MQTIKSGLYYLDCFKPSIALFYQGHPYISTALGRILALLFFVILIVYSIYQSLVLINPIVTSIDQSADYFPTGAPVYLNIESSTFTIGVIVDNKNYMNFSHALVTPKAYIMDNYGNKTEIELEKKNDKILNVQPFNTTIFGCPLIYGVEASFQTIFFEVVTCKNSSIITCSPESENIEEYLKTHDLLFYMNFDSQFFNLGNATNYLSITLNPVDSQLSFNHPASVVMMLDSVKVVTHSGVFLENTDIYYGNSFTPIYYFTSSPLFTNFTLFRFGLCTTHNQFVYTRTLSSLSQVLIAIGGFMHNILSVIQLFVLYFGLREVKRRISKKFISLKKLRLTEKDRASSDSAQISRESNIRENLASSQYDTQDSKILDKVALEFTENALNVNKLIELQKKVDRLSRLVLSKRQKVLFEYAVEKLDAQVELKLLDDHSSFELSEGFKTALRNIDKKTDIEKITKFVKLYRSYVRILEKKDENLEKYLNLLDKSTLESLQEIHESTEYNLKFDLLQIENILLSKMKS